MRPFAIHPKSSVYHFFLYLPVLIGSTKGRSKQLQGLATEIVNAYGMVS